MRSKDCLVLGLLIHLRETGEEVKGEVLLEVLVIGLFIEVGNTRLLLMN